MTIIEEMRQEDVLRNRYQVIGPDLFYSTDITHFGLSYELILFIDLGSRLVVGHKLQDRSFTSRDVILCVKEILFPRTTKNKAVLHTDSGSCFTSSEFQLFCYTNNILLSRAHPKKAMQGNQVSERLNATIKKNLRKECIKIISEKKAVVSQTTANLNKLSLERLSKALSADALRGCVLRAVELYNSSPHKGNGMFNMAPFNIDEAFYQENILKSIPVIARNNNSKNALVIREHRADVVGRYAKNWLSLFETWKQESTQDLEEIKKQNESLALQNHALYEQNRKLQQNVDFLVESEKARQLDEANKEIIRNKRRQSKKLTIRASVSYEEFQFIVNLVHDSKRSDLEKARVKVSLCLMYLTGLRISNLLTLSKKSIMDLVEKGETEVSLIKKGKSRHLLCIGSFGEKELCSFRAEIDYLLLIQPENPMFFVNSLGVNKANAAKDKALNRSLFNKTINGFLAKASVVLDKHIRSHSFRASFVTDLLDQSVPIEKVKDILGHQDIATTATYRRNIVTQKELRAIASKLSRERKGLFMNK